MNPLATRLERIRHVASNFNELQGLKLIPLAIYFWGIALSWSELWYWFTIWRPLSTLGLLIVCIILYVLIDNYYRKRFGQATALPEKKLSQQKLFGVIFVIAFIASGNIEYYAALPFGLTSILITGWLFFLLYAYRPVRNHYVVWSAVMLLMGLLPVFGLYDVYSVYLFGSGAVGSIIVLGMVILLAGILDHLTLLRSIPQTAESAS